MSVIGCRNLTDRQGRTTTAITGSTWVEARLNGVQINGPVVQNTASSAYPSARHPNYLQSLSWKVNDMPDDSDCMFAPSLTLTVKTKIGKGIHIVGTAEHSLTTQLRLDAAERQWQNEVATQANAAAQAQAVVQDKGQAPHTSTTTQTVSPPPKYRRRVRAVKDFFPELESNGRDKLMFNKGTIISLEYDALDQVRCPWERFTIQLCNLSDTGLEWRYGTVEILPDRERNCELPRTSGKLPSFVGTSGKFPANLVEPVLILADEENNPAIGWMKGRAVALHALEHVIAMRLHTVELQCGKQTGKKARNATRHGRAKNSIRSLGSLKLSVTLNATRHVSDSGPAPDRQTGGYPRLLFGESKVGPIPEFPISKPPILEPLPSHKILRTRNWGKRLCEPQPVTVRVYVVGAQDLASKDRNHLSDPYVMVTLDAAVMKTTVEHHSLFSSNHDHTPPWEFREKMAGVWPSGANCNEKMAGRVVEDKVIDKTLNPYFGQCFEFQRIV